MVKIYALFDPREPHHMRYIGKTKMKLSKRVQSHIDEAKSSSSNTHKLAWLRKLAREGYRPSVVLIEECEERDWEARERYFISTYQQSHTLCNTVEGGLPGGSTKSPIVRYTIDGILDKTFDSIEQAASESGFERGLINSALQRDNGFGGGYLWRYTEINNPHYIRPFVKSNLLVIRIKDLQTGEKFIGESLDEALEHFGLSNCGAINRALSLGMPYKTRYSIVRLN